MDTAVALFLIISGPAIMLGIYIGLLWADHDSKRQHEGVSPRKDNP